MRIRTVLLVAVLVLSAVAGPAATVVAADDVALEVVVRTAAGATLDNAEVTASWDGGSNTRTTSSNGRVFIDVPEGADVTIEVDHQFYVRNTPYEITDAAEGEVEVTVWEKASASLTVVDRSGPVEDVRVLFRKGGNFVGPYTTDSQGAIDTGVIESGEYTVSLSKPGYFQEAASIEVTGDTNEEVSIERGSVSVEFRVLDDNFDPAEPVPEATITGPDFSGSSSDDGSRSFSVPVNTELTVTVEKEGYESVQRRIAVGEEAMQVNLSTRRVPAVEVDLPNERVVVGETVRVTITDEYGEPLPEATVYLDGEAIGQPDAQGQIQVTIDQGGDHTLFAQFDQVSSEQLTITGVTSGGSTVVEVVDTATPEQASVQPAGFLAVPGAGQLHLRSLAIGIALGLVLAVGLFVYIRAR